jgi:UDP-glucose 4-epimerase
MILITGGSGYLGGQAAKFLINNGHKVRIATRNKKLVHKSIIDNAEVFETNFLKQKSIDNCCKNIQTIIHFAGMNFSDCEKNPLLAKEINEDSTERFLLAGKKNNIKKFLYFSTAHVYGNQLKENITEEYKPFPENCYSTTHHNAEKLVVNSLINSDIKYLILRLSNVIGPPISKDIKCWHLVCHDLCRQAITSNKIQLNTSGDQYRDFVSIRQLFYVINSFILENKLSSTYNFSSGNSITIKKLATIIQEEYFKIFDKELELLLGKVKLAGNYLYKLDNRKLKNEFNDLKFETINYSIKDLLIFCKNYF